MTDFTAFWHFTLHLSSFVKAISVNVNENAQINFVFYFLPFPYLLFFERKRKKLKTSSERKVFVNYEYKLGKNFYKTLKNNAIVWVQDSGTNSAGMMRNLIDSINYRIQFRFIFEKLDNRKVDKMLRTMMADRLSEIKINSSKRDSYENTLKKQVEYIESVSRNLSDYSSSVFNTHMVFKVIGTHPVSLSQHLSRFLSSLKMTGFVVESDQWYSEKHITRYGDIFQTPGRKYLLDSNAMSAIFPISLSVPPSRGGIVLGLQSMTEKPVFMDIFGRNSFNVMIFGQTGSGKSFLSKLILMRYMNTKMIDELIVVDPLDEYSCSLFSSECKEIRLTEGEYIDILKLNQKNEDLTTAFSLIISNLIGNTLSSTEIYTLIKSYLKDEESPSIQDFLRTAAENANDERLRDVLIELRNSIFERDKELEIDQKTKVLIFKPGAISEDSRPTGILTILLNIMQRIRRSTETKKIVLIDEAHLIVKNEVGSKLLGNLVRHSRHHKTSVINVTQNIGDFLNDVNSKSIVMNSEITILFRTKSKADIDHALFRIEDSEDLSLEDLVGGVNEPYSECYMIDNVSIDKTRIICTENEKKMIDNS